MIERIDHHQHLDRQLPQTIEFVDHHPHLRFVVNHMAKPDICNQRSEHWRTNIAMLAVRENVFSKVSGMVTEACWSGWREVDLHLFWQAVLSTFTLRRLLFGSDSPVRLLASNYQTWFEVVSGWVQQVTTQGRDCPLGRMAVEVYGLH